MSKFEHRALYILPEEVEPSWEARRRLATAVRTLNERCVRTEADATLLAQAEKLIEAAIALLPLGHTASEAFLNGSYAQDPSIYLDRGPLVGRSNPVAPPLHIQAKDQAVRCEVTLGESYVGAPGMVHGGILAACFDQVAGYCAVYNHYLGFTASLEIEYKKPAYLYRELTFTAQVTEAAKRHAVVEAQCREGDQLLARCQGVFVRIKPETGARIFGGG